MSPLSPLPLVVPGSPGGPNPPSALSVLLLFLALVYGLYRLVTSRWVRERLLRLPPDRDGDSRQPRNREP